MPGVQLHIVLWSWLSTWAVIISGSLQISKRFGVPYCSSFDDVYILLYFLERPSWFRFYDRPSLFFLLNTENNYVVQLKLMYRKGKGFLVMFIKIFLYEFNYREYRDQPTLLNLDWYAVLDYECFRSYTYGS